MISTSTCCDVASPCPRSHPYWSRDGVWSLSQSAFLHFGKIHFHVKNIRSECNWMCSQSILDKSQFWLQHHSFESLIETSKVQPRKLLSIKLSHSPFKSCNLKCYLCIPPIQMFTFLTQAAWEREPFSGQRISPFSRTVLWSSYFLIYPTWPFVSEKCLRRCKSCLSW